MQKTKIEAKTILSVLLVVILGLLVYSNSLNGKFIWDDDNLIKDNLCIRSFSNVLKIFTTDIYKGTFDKSAFYRPVQILTYTMDYSLWKLNVIGYHLTNVLLHIIAALIIYWFINILFKDNILSLFASVLFAIHPIHTEAVAYISGRAEMLALIFMLLCFIFYIKQGHTKSMLVYFFMMLCYILALLSKEVTLILPILLILYHYAFKEKPRKKEFIPLIIITFAYIALRLTVLKHLLLCSSSQTSTIIERLPGLFVVIASYLKLLILPFPLHMEYGQKLFHFTNIKAILGILIFISSLIYVFKIRQKNNLIFFSISWFFISLLPVSNIYPINAYMAEHWLYTPSIGFFVLLASGLTFTYRIKTYRLLVIGSAIILCIFYGLLTIKQNNYWKEPIKFYKQTLKYAPNSARVYYNLGNAYHQEDKDEDAIVSYKKAIAFDPNYTIAYYNLGTTYATAGETEEAITSYKKAIALKPDYAEAYNNLGTVYAATGRINEAIILFNKAIKINPDYPNAYYNLGSIYHNEGKNEEAISLYKKAISINPDYLDPYISLGVLYVDTGKPEEAIALFKKAIAINPNDPMAYNNLSMAYFNKKDYKLAIKYCDKAIALGFNVNPEFLKLLEPYRKK